jgi:hypothetical protein
MRLSNDARRFLYREAPRFLSDLLEFAGNYGHSMCSGRF